MINRHKRPTGFAILIATLIPTVVFMQGVAAMPAVAAPPPCATRISTTLYPTEGCPDQWKLMVVRGPISQVNMIVPSATPIPTSASQTPTLPPADQESTFLTDITKIPLPFLIASGVVVLVLIGVLVYFLVLQPRKRRAPLIQAQKLLTKDTTKAVYEEAETLLNQALVAGMHGRDVAEARFTLAYVRAQLEKYSEAAAVVADLRKSGKPSAETLYLDMWLQLKLEKYDTIERIYQDHEGALKNLRDSRMIAGIAFLRLARQCWVRNEVKEALDYYQKVRRLDVKELNERIPEHIDDQQVVIGIRLLLDKRIEDARKQFETAQHTAAESNRSTVQSELGLLLCTWRGEDASSIDSELGRLLQRLEAESKNKPPEEKKQDDELPTGLRLLRNARFWYAVSLVVGWQRLPSKSGLPENLRQELHQRLDGVWKVDPTMLDAKLVEGLIAYYFSRDIASREDALKQLATYRDNGGNLADVLALIEREEKLSEIYRQSLDRYLAIAKGYLQDPTVLTELREALMERLKPFARFRQLGEIDLRQSEIQAAPSIEDLQNRSKLLRMRVEKVIKPKLEKVDPEASNAVNEQVKQVDELTDVLTKNSNELQKAEFGLLAIAGELLLQEEPPEPQSSPQVTNHKLNAARIDSPGGKPYGR